MPGMSRSISSVLLGAGLLLVLIGLSVSMGSGPVDVLAAALVIAVLMYAGAVWLGPLRRLPARETALPTLVVFDRERRIVSGGTPGAPLAEQFPESLHPELERRAAAALDGVSQRFPCLHDGRMMVFEALPVRGADGIIVCGILMSTEGEPAAIAASL
jgi:hypothetical protein